MAIYHFSAQVISRSQGRSSVSAAAYRAGEKIADERTGDIHNFSKKNDVIASEILLPKNAPEWMLDRDKLWNAVELKENRKDAQLAREINIALPRELSDQTNWEMAKAFVQKEFVDRGMVADLNFHRGHIEKEEQPHIHVMLTTREVNENGFGQKDRSWNDRALLRNWREAWAIHCNAELAKNGFDIRIDHRTLADQGIDLEPQSKIGAKSAEFDMARYAEHQEIAQRNGERILNDPSIALKALTAQQSTFTHQDMARIANRHSVDVPQFQAVFAAIRNHPDLVLVGTDDKRQERFTTKETLLLESKLLDTAIDKAQMANHLVSDKHIEAALASRSLSDDQKATFEYLVNGGDLSCAVGFAGTGKSYLLGAAREAWEAQGYQVKGMTLSGIAAENLEAESGIKSSTVAKNEYAWQNGYSQLSKNDIVVIDEAGMLGSRQMGNILEQADKSGAKVVLIGDPEQLQPIDAGGAFRAIIENTGFAELTDIRRQKHDWQKNATKDFATQQTQAGLLAYDVRGNLNLYETSGQAAARMVERWDEIRATHPEKSLIMLAYSKKEVRAINNYARNLLEQRGDLGENHTIMTGRGEREFATGDRIFFLKNDYQDLNVKNGTLGTIKSIDGRYITVNLDAKNGKAREVNVDTHSYNMIEHGYATTVHKSQGVTVDRTLVLASQFFNRFLTYVVMSRHREGVDMYYGADKFKNFLGLCRVLSRDRTKDMSIDYGKTRGFDTGNLSKSFDLLKHVAPEHADKIRDALPKLNGKYGMTFSTTLHPGAQGKLLGVGQLDGQKYALMGFGEKHAALVPAELMTSTVKNETCVVKRDLDNQGNPKLKVTQPSIEQITKNEIQKLSDQLGLKIDKNLYHGDTGIYRGICTIANERYGLVEYANKEASLIPADRMQNQEKGQSMTIESRSDRHGNELLVGMGSKVPDRELQVEREIGER